MPDTALKSVLFTALVIATIIGFIGAIDCIRKYDETRELRQITYSFAIILGTIILDWIIIVLMP